jgi:hypothetical protein
MKPNPPLYCLSCERQIPNRRDRKTSLCRSCSLSSRCRLCGQILGSGEHICAGIDARGERKCILCRAVLKQTGWERYAHHCGRCLKARWRERIRELRADLVYEFGNRCSRCGYGKCLAALHFHHKDKSEKYEWRKGGGTSIKEVQAHPERFDLLCANCHIEEHQPHMMTPIEAGSGVRRP